MTKYLWAVILLMGLGLTALGLLYRSEVKSAAVDRAQLKTATEALNRAAVQRKRDQATLVARTAANAATARQLAHAQEGLQKALQDDLAWSNTSVPPGVQKALTEDSDGSIPKAD